MATMLTKLGVSRDAILLETRGRCTYQNAVNTQAILETRGIYRVLLVMSAFQLHRAAATIKALRVDVVPAPTGYEVVGTEALFRMTYAMKEYMGYLVYRWRGQL